MSKKQNLVFVFAFMNTTMCLCMSIAGLLVNAGFITLPMFLVTFGESLVICNVCAVVLRIPQQGEWISKKLCGGRVESRWFGLFWMPVVNGTLNSFWMTTFMTLINVGFCREYFAAWAHGAPVMELVSVIVSLVTSPPLMKLAQKITD